MEWKTIDLIIIGGGPCGLAVAIAAKKAGLSAMVLEKGAIAESIRKYPLHMTFFSTSDNIAIGNLPFPTIGPKASRSEALAYYRKAVAHFDVPISTHTPVYGIQHNKVFEVSCDLPGTPKAHHVVIATGYFDKPRQLSIPGFSLPHVSSYYSEAHPYAYQKVVILGGGNSASEAALDLYRNGAEVTMVVREPHLKPTVKYWLKPDLENRIKEGKIKLIVDSQAVEIDEERVFIQHNKTGKRSAVEARFVLSLIGYDPEVTLLDQLGVPYDPETLIPEFNPETFETPVPGCYVAGTTVAGIRTERVFIENGRLHGAQIVKDILRKKQSS